MFANPDSLKKQQEKQEAELASLKINDTVIDRWSMVFIVLIVAIIVSIILISKHKIKYSWIPIGVSVIPFAITAMSAGRIRRNEYDKLVYFKGEKDCGFRVGADYKAIDGIMIEGTTRPPIYKTANGTDLIIKKDGTINPVGFGTRLINHLDGGGYQNEAPDDCWKITQ